MRGLSSTFAALTALAAFALIAGVAVSQTAGELVLKIAAAPATHYQMLCHVRTYKTKEGGLANQYGVEKSGPYSDTIPSPNAQCHIKIVGGAGPLTVSLSKPGVMKTVTVAKPGDAGEQMLVIF